MPAAVYGSLEMAILDPDAFALATQAPGRKGPIRIAYLSVGQVAESRWYWPLVSGQPFVLDEDPNWPQAHNVDLRSPQWQALLSERVIPRILARGYDGFFLDTLDVAAYLEDKDRKKYAGSGRALERFVRSLRKRFPGSLLVANNALPLLEKWGDAIDAEVVEDLYTRYRFQTKTYENTSQGETARMERVLSAFHRKFKKPVFVLVYAEPGQYGDLARPAVARALSRGFSPYVSAVALTSIGRIAPEAP